LNEELDQHKKAINAIIFTHFAEAEERLDDIAASHFTNTKVVWKRHWRNKKDIASDLLCLPRHTYKFIASNVFKKKSNPLPKSGKEMEVQRIISEQFLDLNGLDHKVNEYMKSILEKHEKAFKDLLNSVPNCNRKEFAEEMEKQLVQLNTPIEGAREAIMFLLVGTIGKSLSEKVMFGSAVSTGQAAATSLYLAQLPWYQAGTISVFQSLPGWVPVPAFLAVPGWVAAAGASAGILIGAAIAPLMSPLVEVGFNKLSIKRSMGKVLNAARDQVTQDGPDYCSVAGKMAIYLQVFPDIIHLGRKTMGHLIV